MAVLSVVAAALWLGLPETLGLTIMTVGLLIPRLYRLPGPFDTAFCITIFIATWSGIAGLYRAISWWDLVVHFVTAGASAAVLYLILARSNITPTATRRIFPARSVIVLTFALGMSAAVFWEFLEWAGNKYITHRILVGYDDTLADLAVGGFGALLAGAALAHWATRDTRTHNPQEKDRHESDRIST